MNNSKRTHTLKYLLFASAAFLMSFSALSKDHKIILIHGLQVSQITNKSGSDVIHDGETYWQTYWNNRAVNVLIGLPMSALKVKLRPIGYGLN